MPRPQNKQCFIYGDAGAAGQNWPPMARQALPFPIRRSGFHLLPIFTAIALAFLLSQGCAAMGVTLLGAAATTATKTGVSYTIDSKAHKTFTAPLGQVKASLLAALGEMAFPVETDEKTEDGQRVVARVDGREVEVELEPVTPKATKVIVIVRQGWFWKDRATAEELIEQTARGVDAVVLAARVAAAGATTAAHKMPAEGELRPAALLDPWDPQRWRDSFTAPSAPLPVVEKLPAQRTKPEPAVLPVSQVAPPPVALGGGRPAAPEASPVPEVRVALATATPSGSRPNAAKKTDGSDNRWRVIRTLRLRACPGTACSLGGTLKRGDVVVRLREKDQWWRVWLGGTDLVGWVPAEELAPQRWWDPPKRPMAVSAR